MKAQRGRTNQHTLTKSPCNQPPIATLPQLHTYGFLNQNYTCLPSPDAAPNSIFFPGYQPYTPVVSIHTRDEIRHGIGDSCESLPMAVPRVDPQSHFPNGLSCAHSTDSGQIQGSLMYFVSSWRPTVSPKSR